MIAITTSSSTNVNASRSAVFVRREKRPAQTGGGQRRLIDVGSQSMEVANGETLNDTPILLQNDGIETAFRGRKVCEKRTGATRVRLGLLNHKWLESARMRGAKPQAAIYGQTSPGTFH
jgi:hypothetical protein